MSSLNYEFLETNFSKVMKAQFRKYFDEAYRNKNTVIEVDRKLIDKDTLEIYRVHVMNYFISTSYIVEKIRINRKEKTTKSEINTSIFQFLYKEKCVFSENKDGKSVDYIQNYDINSMFKTNKELTFKKGCEVLEKIISQMNLL